MDDKPATLEEVRLIRTILAELTRQAESDLSVFTYNVRKYDEDPFEEKEDKSGVEREAWKRKVSWVDIEFNPQHNQNHPHREVDKVELCWCQQTREITVELCYSHMVQQGSRTSRQREEQYNETFKLGYNNELNGEYAKLKIEFIKLYKKVKYHYDEYLPRKKRQDFEAAVYGTFPALLDEILMENEDDKKES